MTATTSKPHPSSVGITAFTKISKSKVISLSPREKGACSVTTQLVTEPYSDRKRKLPVIEEIKVDKAGDEAFKLLPGRCLKDSQTLPQTPKNPILAPSNSSSVDTPTKGARALLDELGLCSSLPRDYSSSPPLKSQESAITYDESENLEDEKLPTELLDLSNLHASFLTALSIHHAYNGVHNPVDLRLLCPDVARTWGKRRVMLDDIRRVLGVLNSATLEDNQSKGNVPGRLTLSDYGYGKICVEMTSIGKRGKVARPLDENRLNNTFASTLRKIWKERENTNVSSITTFVQNLPLETISTCSSLTKISPLLAKGQRRLEDLRAGITLKNRAEKEKVISVPAKGDNVLKPTLLERLKAKELRQSMLPAPPSKAELGRNAALHRLGEVVAILSLLTTSTSIGQQRVSFTLPTILGKLKDSFKTPMSKEEGETCVRLLASEIAPEWLKVVRMGKVDAIVVNRDNRPSDLDIQERVRHAA